MKNLTCITILLIVGLVACNGQATTTAPSLVMPTLTPLPTILPTNTPSSIHTTTQTPTGDCNGNPMARNSSENFSPDHSWKFIFCVDIKTDFLYTRLIEANGSKSWNVPFYETFGIRIKDKSFLDGLKDTQMVITHWSSDGHYAYLSPYICCIDGPVLLNGVPALYQLDLNTGKLQDMLPFGGRIGFSPDDKYLAYRTLPATVYLRNLQTGDDKSFTLNKKYVNLGVFSWSPDSSKFVFVAALKDWDQNMYEPTPVSKNGFSLLLLDIETMKITTLIDNDLRMLVPGSASYYESDNAWADNDRIYLAQINMIGRDESKIWLYDINKQQLIAFSTPNP